MEELRRARDSVFLLKASWSRLALLRPAPRRPVPGVVVKGTGRQRDKPARVRAKGRIALPATLSWDQHMVAWVSAVSYSPRPPRSSTCPEPRLSTATQSGLTTRLLVSSSPGTACLSASGLAPEQWAGICHLIGCCGMSITGHPSPSRGALRHPTITSGVGRAQGCWPVRERASCCWRVAREPEALQVGRAAAGPSERRGPRRPAAASTVSPGACLSQGLGTWARLRGAKLRGHARYLPDCPVTREPAFVHGRRDRYRAGTASHIWATGAPSRPSRSS